MQIERTDHDHYTDIAVYNEGDRAWNSYRITCMNIDIIDGQRAAPTAQISLLILPPGADYASVRRLVAEYTYVADLAEALQAEKRAAFGKDV